MARNKNTVSEYRNYNLPLQFPVQLLTGERWLVTSRKKDSLHFHNCLEIGLCLSGCGEMEFYGEKYSYQAGDFTVIPRNVPHSTQVLPGSESLWCYLMADPQELFHPFLPANRTAHDLSSFSYKTVPTFFAGTSVRSPGSCWYRLLRKWRIRNRIISLL